MIILQLFLIFLGMFKTTYVDMLYYNTNEEIILRPFDDYEIRCFLIEETNLELWLLLIHKQSQTESFLLNKRFRFKRNVLNKTKIIFVNGVLKIRLILSITKTETNFQVHITSFTCIRLLEVKIIRDCFVQNLSLDSLYFGEKLEYLKNNLISENPRVTFSRRCFIKQKTKEQEKVSIRGCCGIFW